MIHRNRGESSRWRRLYTKPKACQCASLVRGEWRVPKIGSNPLTTRNVAAVDATIYEHLETLLATT